MRVILFSFILILIHTLSSAQEFPELEGENLNHEQVLIPNDIQGKHTLIGLAFSKKSEKYLNQWFDPVYQQLIAPPKEGSLFAFSYDVNVYFIPMLTGAKRPAYKEVMKRVEKDVDAQLHPNILFYKGSLNSYKDALKIKDKNLPYFYLLDKTGKIIYATSGSYNPRKLQSIVDQLPFE